MKTASALAAFALMVSCSSSFAQAPDEAEIVKKRDWDGMRKIGIAAQKAGDNALATRKFFEAWSYARFWAVYNPAEENSGSQRAEGIRGMGLIRTDAAGLGLDDTFRELDTIRAENPPQVFSGGKNNTGLWNLEKDLNFTMKQNGSHVVGTLEFDPPKGGMGGKIVFKLEGNGFDGTKMNVELSSPGNERFGSMVGVFTFDGNKLSGKLRNPMTKGELDWSVTRTWIK